MHVDCGNCAVRGPACEGCLVSAVIGAPRRGVELTDVEQRALRVLAGAGLVPTLLYLPVDAPVELIPVDLIPDDPDGPCGFLPVEMAPPTAVRRRPARRRAA